MSWSGVVRIDEKWGNVPRCKPLTLRSGEVIFGVEYDDGNSRVWRSGDNGASWEMGGRIEGEKNQHPALIEGSDGSILALLRPCGGQGRLLQSVLEDGGETWEPAATTELTSPFAALDAVRLDDGRFLVVYNSNPAARNPLTVAVSEDEGRTWPIKRDLVTGEGRFRYPAVIQDREGNIQITFTNNRIRIDHVVMEAGWLEGEGKGLLWEEEQRKFV